MSRRIAILAAPAMAGLHGVDRRFDWGECRTFEPGGAEEALAAWSPDTLIALRVPAPDGPWHAIAWDADAPRRVSAGSGEVWRRAPLPAADALAELHARCGRGVVIAAGDEQARQSALKKLLARDVPARGVATLTREAIEEADVVALLGASGAPLPGAATAVLAAGRVLIAPRAEPLFGLLPWSDHVPYENEDELVFSADAAYSFPRSFEPVAAMGVVTAVAHRASDVYARLALDAELEDALTG